MQSFVAQTLYTGDEKGAETRVVYMADREARFYERFAEHQRLIVDPSVQTNFHLV